MLDQRANLQIWRLFFMSTTMKVVIHLGHNYHEHLTTYRNTNFELKTLLDITQKLSLNQKHEILNVSTMELQFTPWMRSALLHDKAPKCGKAKVHVYSDSVLCLGRMHRQPEAKEKWNDLLQYFQESDPQHCRFSKRLRK